MSGYVASLHLPVEGAVGEEVQQFTAGNIVFGIHQVEVTVQRVDDDAVGHADLTDLWGIGETCADNLMSAHINNAVGDGVRHRHLAPLAAIEIEGVAHDTEVADGLVQITAHRHSALGILY